MIKTKNLAGAQAVTANRLRDGAVVFLRDDGTWSSRVEDSAVASDADASARLMAAANQAVAERIVVAPYLIEVESYSGKVVPLVYRERIRAYGPSIPVTGAARAAAAAQ